MGDPHGVGPEVLLKALQHSLQDDAISPILFGAEDYLSKLYSALNLNFDWNRVRLVSVGRYPYPPRWGRIDETAGHLALEALRSATVFCREQKYPLLVTAPVNKAALNLTGFSDPGQTEYVGSFFESADPTMIFLSQKLKVLLTTVHISLRRMFEQLTVERLINRAVLFLSALQKLGTPYPRVAVCGVNPHASENGMFGDEEQDIVIPAMRQLEQRFGAGVFWGPFPPDTVFNRALDGEFDGVIAHYHDQGLIPFKLVAFSSGVNVTLGLPIVRTSPDHGTAFDIAGKGVADPGSMLAAVEWGLKLI